MWATLVVVGNICHLIQVCLFLLLACNQPAWLSQPAAAFPKASCSCLCLGAAPAQRRQILPLTSQGSLFLPDSQLPCHPHSAVIPTLSFPRCPALRPSPFSACSPCPLPMAEPSLLSSPAPLPLASGGLARPLWEPAGQEAVGELLWGRQSRPALTKAWAQLHHHREGRILPPRKPG